MKIRTIRSRAGWALILGGALLAAACGDDGGDTDTTGDMGVTMDGEMPDPCEGLTLCSAAGTSCTGDALVTCAANADGCLVETTMDCGAVGGTCDDSGTDAMCQTDPCADIPAEDRCDTEGATCDGDSLVECAMNAEGCLVQTTTDCAAAEGGECDDTDTPMCVLPADPCADIPAAERCDTEGTSCDGDNLTTCAPNAFGCLVETTDDCTARAGGTCDDSGAAAVCTATDPCAGVTECATEGTMCNGPELVTCAPDAFGCLVETTEDCTEAMFGFCDADGSPASCSTAASDPCMGMTTCAAEGRACDGDTLEVCARNEFGCLVETPTDCTADGNVCGDADGTAQCGPVCSFRDTCPSMNYCDPSGELVSCSADADGCLIEDGRMGCGDGVCSGDACVGNCPGASPTVIDCASGTVNGDTAMGTMALNDYSDCTSSTSYSNGEQVFIFQNAAAAEVSITSTRGAGTGDYDLFVLAGGDGTDACGTADTCVDSSRGVGANETIDFVTAPGELYYIAYDLFGSTAETTDFTLDVTCTPIVCGDGVIAGDEECDDGDVAAGDGCSDTCTIETDYLCEGEPSTCRMITCGDGFIDGTEECDDGDMDAGDGCSDACAVEAGYICGGEPSVCRMPTNVSCGAATAITADTTIADEDISFGGPRPQGTGCGTSSGDNALYYEVTIPANTMVDVTTTSSDGLDRVMLFQDSCAATECTYRTDSRPERGTLLNTTGSPVTRIVAVHNYSSTGTGTYDISFAYAPIPYMAITGACVDTTAGVALGVTTDDSASSVAALPFSVDWFGGTATHYSATSNGFAQLWPDATGSPSTAYTNSRLPGSGTPNGVVAPFWDDLRPNLGADVFALTSGSAGSQRFVLEWRNWRASFSGTEDLTFQVHFYEATGQVEYHYCAMNAGVTGSLHTGSSATIGAESFDGTDGFSISHSTAGAVMTGSGFSLDP